MKKFVLVVALFLISSGFVFAVDPANDDSLLITGTVSQHLWVTLGSDVVIEELNTLGGNVSLGNAAIRSNIKSWYVRFKADKGALTLWDSTASDYASGGQDIDYTFAFTDAVGNNDLTTYGNPLHFVRKTENGSNAEDFAMSITYAPQGADNWEAGTYKDTISVQVTVL